MRTRLLTATVMVWLALAGTPAAQNRAELQMNADLRMIQEQVSRLQLATNQLTEQLKIINKRMDDQSSASQKQVADVRLLITNLANTVNTIREKVDDNTVRVSQLGQELPAIRSGLGMVATQLNTLVGLLQPPGQPDRPERAARILAGSDRQRPAPGLAHRDFPGGDERLHGESPSTRDRGIHAVRHRLSRRPRRPPKHSSTSAWSYFNDKKGKEAIDAFDKVVKNYKGSAQVPDALFQQALVYMQLGQKARGEQALSASRQGIPGNIVGYDGETAAVPLIATAPAAKDR